MIKKTILVATTLALLAGAAAPAFAENNESVFNNGAPSRTGVLQELNQKGVNATDVEQWGNYIRAYVTQPNGTQVMEYFTPGSLNPVTP
jgi:hypothetical protein